MQLKITTWNINSVRLRIDQVARVAAEIGPDVLCLQETKCPDEHFPLAAVRRMGFEHAAVCGQKGYNGVAIFSKVPLRDVDRGRYVDRADCRHISAGLDVSRLTGRDEPPITVHNYYVPAGGDVADPLVNAKFAHKLGFIGEMRAWSAAGRPSRSRSILVGDLNIAPYESDVWNHKALLDVVSHTPVETSGLEAVRVDGGWIDAVRQTKPEPERVYTWWSYRSPDWSAADKGRRLDHIWTTPDLAPGIAGIRIDREARGWLRPSDHVPVTVTFEL